MYEISNFWAIRMNIKTISVFDDPQKTKIRTTNVNPKAMQNAHITLMENGSVLYWRAISMNPTSNSIKNTQYTATIANNFD